MATRWQAPADGPRTSRATRLALRGDGSQRAHHRRHRRARRRRDARVPRRRLARRRAGLRRRRARARAGARAARARAGRPVRSGLGGGGRRARRRRATTRRSRAVVNLVGGFALGGRVHETPIEDFEAQLRLNLRPTYLVCQAALPHLQAAGGGAIVCVSSRAALRAVPRRRRLHRRQGRRARVRRRAGGGVPRRRHPRQRDPAERHRYARQPPDDARRRPRALGLARADREPSCASSATTGPRSSAALTFRCMDGRSHAGRAGATVPAT